MTPTVTARRAGEFHSSCGQTGPRLIAAPAHERLHASHLCPAAASGHLAVSARGLVRQFPAVDARAAPVRNYFIA